jgi:predicted xylose isomerase-like sugar epimerase
MLLRAWRRIAHRAGMATAVEPARERLCAASIHATKESGDLLAAPPESGLAVANVSAVHPLAITYVDRAARSDGAVADAQDGEKGRK